MGTIRRTLRGCDLLFQPVVRSGQRRQLRTEERTEEPRPKTMGSYPKTAARESLTDNWIVQTLT